MSLNCRTIVRKHFWLPTLAALAAFQASGAFAAPPAAAPMCKPGMSVSEDSEGHCCWAGQAWRNRCVGRPLSCPEGMEVKADACVETPCPVGQEKMPDHLHCCWVGQAWSKSRDKCIGVPNKCPAGTVADADAEQCILKVAAVAPKPEVKAPTPAPKAPPAVVAAPKAAPSPAPAAKPAVTCPNGQSISPDTDGHCCWTGQVWQDRCVGRPTACPDGSVVKGDQCAEKGCDPGMERVGAGGQTACCWPGQAWSKSRNLCVGTPTRCPDGMGVDPDGESCKAKAAPPPVVAKPKPAEDVRGAKQADSTKCPPGETISPDTSGHCCPPDNRWSLTRGACVSKDSGKQGSGASNGNEEQPASKPEAPPPSKVKRPIQVEFEPSREPLPSR